MNTILCLGIVLVGALVAERIISYLKIPAITSYILLGILLGPYALNVTGGGLIASSELLSNIVLGFIAFHIGKNFSVEHFKRIGKAVLSVSISVTVATLLFRRTLQKDREGSPLRINHRNSRNVNLCNGRYLLRGTPAIPHRSFIWCNFHCNCTCNNDDGNKTV